MSEFAKNQIVSSNGEDVIFVSFLCPEDNERDEISLEELKKIMLSNVKIELGAISYSIDYDKEDLKVIVTGRLDGSTTDFCSKVDLQEFVDEFATSIYNDKSFNDSAVIKKVVEHISSQMVYELFQSEGRITSHIPYLTPVMIYSGDKTLLCAQSIEFNNKEKTVSIYGGVSHFSLKDIEFDKITVITNKMNIELTGDADLLSDTEKKLEIIDSEEGIVKKYVIKYENVNVVENKSEVPYEVSLDYMECDKEEFFDRYVKFINSKEEILNNESVDDLFDDLDF